MTDSTTREALPFSQRLSSSFSPSLSCKFTLTSMTLPRIDYSCYMTPHRHFLFHRRGSNSIVASLAVELGLLAVLWAIMLGETLLNSLFLEISVLIEWVPTGGAAAMSDQLFGLSWCTGSLCSLGRAVQAFAWIAWISLTLLLALVITLAVLSKKKGDESIWTRPLHISNEGGQLNTSTSAPRQASSHPQSTNTATPAQTTTHPEMSTV